MNCDGYFLRREGQFRITVKLLKGFCSGGTTTRNFLPSRGGRPAAAAGVREMDREERVGNAVFDGAVFCGDVDSHDAGRVLKGAVVQFAAIGAPFRFDADWPYGKNTQRIEWRSMLDYRISDLGDVGVTLLHALPNAACHTVWVFGYYGLRWDAAHETAYPSTFLIDRQGVIFFSKIVKEHGGRTTAAEILDAMPKRKATE